ncbi:hypothetical protein Tco_0583089 [Tanacetum coccineum]
MSLLVLYDRDMNLLSLKRAKGLERLWHKRGRHSTCSPPRVRLTYSFHLNDDDVDENKRRDLRVGKQSLPTTFSFIQSQLRFLESLKPPQHLIPNMETILHPPNQNHQPLSSVTSENPGNHTEAYQIFAEMLKKFDRDDLVKLWDLVKERFSTTKPTNDKEKELWVELKRLFKPDSDDTLWKLQRYMHDPLVWRLYDTCGVHRVSLAREHDIFMLVEKDYPLSKGVQMLMVANKLLVEQHSEMANELLRKIFIQAIRPRQ